MGSISRTLLPVLALGGFVAGGCTKAGQTAKADGGSPDHVAADTRSADAGATLGDGQPGDAPSIEPDAGVADTVLPEPDAGPVDGALPAPDGIASDANPPSPDGHASDASSRLPDGGPSDEEIIRACALAASCAGGGTGSWTASQCVNGFGWTINRHNDVLFGHLLDCAGARTCAEFRTCWGGDWFLLDPMFFDSTCQGNVLTLPARTPGSPPLALDCGAIGGVCEMLATGSTSYGCNVRSCRGAPEPACTGTTATGCGGWSEYKSVDCARIGLDCRIQGYYAVCAGSGAACEVGNVRSTCSGTVATYCAGGALATLDCSRNRFRTACSAGALSEPCAPAGTECVPDSFRGQCDGSKLKLCVDGKLVAVDCRDLGFPSCADSSSTDYARCREGA
jgi:hypothetical protein